MTVSDVKLDKLIEDLKKQSAHGNDVFVMKAGNVKAIIAALERPLPVDAGTHEIRPIKRRRRITNAEIKQAAGEPVNAFETINAEPREFQNPRHD